MGPVHSSGSSLRGRKLRPGRGEERREERGEGPGEERRRKLQLVAALS